MVKVFSHSSFIHLANQVMKKYEKKCLNWFPHHVVSHGIKQIKVIKTSLVDNLAKDIFQSKIGYWIDNTLR